ncbi:MAG: tannase/feruloyl esterase family alpha/beta hydrolase [Acidobacteria bacterium]|nr:tannase/feruloyl esterase family alpha/beta hydrolase [Acidobacteriota bacterium]
MNRRTIPRASAVAGVLVAGLVHASLAAAATCESLFSLALPNTQITSASMIDGVCRVAATLTPSADSDIKIEVWLPDAAGWNGKFQAVGNGGWAGVISSGGLAAGVGDGYATASTDTGHVGNTAAFALGHPEKLTDMAHRAVHEMTVQAKALINAYYDSAPTLSFWNGCSFGGRQGITAAQRYPDDFDAIVAGAPAVNWMDLHVGRTAMNLAANKAPIPPAKYPVIHDAVLQACDGLDGVKDGVLENPLACRFDPEVLQCKGGKDGPSCLTSGQVKSAQAMYTGVKNPETGAVVVPGLEPGTELNWAVLGGPSPNGNALEAEKYIVHQDPKWNLRSFDLKKDLELASAVDPALSSSSTDLKAFFDRGGRLLMYHGFSDPQVPDRNTIDYFTKVADGAGKGLVGTQLQLYMVPGMDHCQGGPGTDRFNKMAAIESWVATGAAPNRIIGSHVTAGKVDRTRPICPFGQVAKWDGVGSIDDEASFACVAGSAGAETK